MGERYTTFDVVGAGPRIVAGLLEQHSLSVKLKSYELFFEEDPREYDIVMVSVMSTDKGALKRVIKHLNEKSFSGVLVVGGPASFEYDTLLKTYERVDYVVVGEAEIPLLRIIPKLDSLAKKNYEELKDVPALAYRVNGRVELTSPHTYTPVEILSEIKPWVKISLSYENYPVLRYYVEVVRGCSNYQRPMITGYAGLDCKKCVLCKSPDLERRLACPASIPPGCGFCSVPYMFGPARSKPVDSIVEEVESLIANGARRIVLSAPDFLDYGRDALVKPKPLTNPCEPPANTRAIEELLEAVFSIERVREGRVRVYIENLKACLVDESVAEILGKYFKNTTVHIGLETGDDWFNEYVLGKPIYKSHVFKAVKLLSSHGLRPYVYLIYGIPLMNRRVYTETIKVVKELAKLGVEKITLYKYVKLPGTGFSNIDFSVAGVEDLVAKLKDAVARINREKKRVFVNRDMLVYLVYSRGRYYGYPVDHGPVVFVKGLKSPEYNNCLAVVRVYDTGLRHLWGRFIRVVEC